MNDWRGLRLQVYWNGATRACAFNGPSVDHDTVCLVGTLDHLAYDKPKPVDVAPLRPRDGANLNAMAFPGATVALAIDNVTGSPRLTFAPVDWDDDLDRYVRRPGWAMMGGNYATGDSRVSSLLRDYVPGFYGAVAIHDRIE